MLENFSKDLVIGRRGEEIVLNTLSNLTTDYEFTDVSKDHLFYDVGDIRATDKKTGKDIYIEVKNDSRIGETQNVLCEKEVYYYSSGSFGSGNMSGCGDIYIVVSEPERELYILDYKLLRKNYRKGEYREIRHAQQITYCYLCGLPQIEEWGALLYKLKY